MWWLLSPQRPYLHQKRMSNVNILPVNQATYINRYKNTKRKVLLSNTKSNNNNNSRQSHWLKPMWLMAITLTPCVNTLDLTIENTKPETPNTHRWHTHAATYCVIIQTQWTQISGRNSNGTKHSRGPPEDGREKRPKHVGVLYLQTCF